MTLLEEWAFPSTTGSLWCSAPAELVTEHNDLMSLGCPAGVTRTEQPLAGSALPRDARWLGSGKHLQAPFGGCRRAVGALLTCWFDTLGMSSPAKPSS